MRRELLSKAQFASSSTRNAVLKKPLPAPFVCANCRRAVSPPTTATHPESRRSFANIAPLKQQASTTETTRGQRESILPQTHYDLFPETFPNGSPPNSAFTPDLRQLRKEYLQLQAKSHPDLAPQEQKRHAEAVSMRLNEAYKTIQDPLRRARYLLALRGIDMEDESAQLADNDLLMEVMELREAVEEAEDEEQLAGIRAENNERVLQSVKVLEEAFAKGEIAQAAEEAIRLRYWTNIEESIQGWEKGKGGGLLHH